MYTVTAARVYTIRPREVYTVTSDDRIGIRELRAKLREYVDASEPVIIGNYYSARAILVPIHRRAWAPAKEINAERSRAKQKFTEALARALPLP